MNSTLHQLLSVWLALGGLQLERITWQTPCDLLQKVFVSRLYLFTDVSSFFFIYLRVSVRLIIIVIELYESLLLNSEKLRNPSSNFVYDAAAGTIDGYRS